MYRVRTMHNRTTIVLLICAALLIAGALAIRAHGGGFLARLAPAIHGH